MSETADREALVNEKILREENLFLREEIEKLTRRNTLLERHENEVRQALYDHAGQHRVGHVECRDAFEIRLLRHERNILRQAIRTECAKFEFPEEDRCDLHETLITCQNLRKPAARVAPSAPAHWEEEQEVQRGAWTPAEQESK